MKMILADRRDYKNGFKKHYVAYNLLKEKNDSVISRCLLLVYSVECGLKCLLLDKWRENSPKNILGNEDDKRNEVIKSHNIQKILITLGQSRYRFPQMTTKHGDIINTNTYHQLHRYGIKLKDTDIDKAELYEQELLKVVDWIEKEI